MNSNPTVSVIVPAYNAQDTLARTIDSVLAQTLACHEIIVIDDGSSSPLAPVVARFGSKVRLIRQENAGPARARNHGIELATGDVIAFLDADDFWEPEKLKKQCEILSAHAEVGLVASRFYLQQPECSRRELAECDEFWLDRIIPSPRGRQLFELTSLIWTGTVLIRRSALADDRFTPSVVPAEDRDLWLRVLQRHAAFVISEPLATAVLVPGSISRSDPDKGYSPMIDVLHRHAHLVSPRELRNLEAVVYRAWAGVHLAENRPRRALAKAFERLQRQPISLEAWWIVSKSAMLSIAPGAN